MTDEQKDSAVKRHVRKIIRESKSLPKAFEKVNKTRAGFFFTLRSGTKEDKRNLITFQLYRLVVRISIPQFLKPMVVGTLIKGGNKKKFWETVSGERVYGAGYLLNEKLFVLYHGVNSGNVQGLPKDKIKMVIPFWEKYKVIKNRFVGFNSSSKEADKLMKFKFTYRNALGGTHYGVAYIEETAWAKGVVTPSCPVFKSNIKLKRYLNLVLTETLTSVEFPMLPEETVNDAIVRHLSRTSRHNPLLLMWVNVE